MHMSAATERLVERIKVLEEEIQVAEVNGKDSTWLKSNLKLLQRRLQTCNETLNETKQLLKS